MSPSTQQLSEIRARAEKATKGPWRWDLNLKAKTVELEGVTGMLETVMRPARWGMGGAKLQFIKDGLMEDCETFAKPKPNREHHQHWCADIDHPDAQFIAHAREDVPNLLNYVEELQKAIQALTAFNKLPS